MTATPSDPPTCPSDGSSGSAPVAGGRPRPGSEMPVFLVDHDPGWPDRFVEERRRLAAALSLEPSTIEHVGSTAIPGMRAKPILDIMVLIPGIGDAKRHVPALAALDYHYFPYAEDRTPERRWFCKPDPRARTHHLHLVERESAFHHDHLLFRDFLRARPEEARAYLSLKEALAARFPTDREAYTEGKTGFVRAALERARVWQGDGP